MKLMGSNVEFVLHWTHGSLRAHCVVFQGLHGTLLSGNPVFYGSARNPCCLCCSDADGATWRTVQMGVEFSHTNSHTHSYTHPHSADVLLPPHTRVPSESQHFPAASSNIHSHLAWPHLGLQPAGGTQVPVQSRTAFVWLHVSDRQGHVLHCVPSKPFKLVIHSKRIY